MNDKVSALRFTKHSRDIKGKPFSYFVLLI